MNQKQEELLERLATVLRDLEEARRTDHEAIWEIGSLAATLVGKTDAPSWTAFKEALTQDMYEGLVRDFQTEGNALWQAGKSRKAYAVQAIAASVVSVTQRRVPQLAQGEKLLDEAIQNALVVYRRTQKPN